MIDRQYCGVMAVSPTRRQRVREQAESANAGLIMPASVSYLKRPPTAASDPTRCSTLRCFAPARNSASRLAGSAVRMWFRPAG